MNELFVNSVTVGVVLSIFAYQLGVFLKKKTKSPFVNPLLVSIVIVMVTLVVLKVDYESYNHSAKYLSYLLTPATVSLAIPLYRQIENLKKNFKAIIVSVFAGAITSMCTILVMAMLFGLSHEEYVTLLPKSITTAIGMGVSEELGGYVTITVAVIIVTGILGNIIGEFICKTFHIQNPISRGLALGTSAHAIGTTKAMEMGEVEGAMSSLAIVVAGLITVVGASLFAILW